MGLTQHSAIFTKDEQATLGVIHSVCAFYIKKNKTRYSTWKTEQRRPEESLTFERHGACGTRCVAISQTSLFSTMFKHTDN